jgi:DNA-binding MarR family transcriptional regulator
MPKAPRSNAQIADQLNSTKRYIESTLHRATRIGAAIPLIPPREIASRYALFEASIGGHSCALALPHSAATPDQVAHNINLFGRELGKLTIYTPTEMTSADRSRLIQRSVPFVVPGNQIYIPELALDLRETFRRPITVYKAGLSPVSQAVLFHVALAGADETTPSQIASGLDYTPMSVGRALDELAARGLGKVERRGREKVFLLSNRREVIKDARPLLLPPFRGVYAVRFRQRRPKMLQAGETALATLAGIRIDAPLTFAIPSPGRTEYFNQHGIEDIGDIDAADALIETWRYDPAILSKGPCVDPLSLYAQYWQDTNPRLAEAAEKLMTKVLG